MVSLHQLRCFLTTYELGSLTAAAEELGYAQPSISEQIRSLEKALGVQLFRRVGRGVVPTTVADELRPHAERTLAAAEDARKVCRARSSSRPAPSGSECSERPGCTSGPSWSPTSSRAIRGSASSSSARTRPRSTRI